MREAYTLPCTTVTAKKNARNDFQIATGGSDVLHLFLAQHNACIIKCMLVQYLPPSTCAHKPLKMNHSSTPLQIQLVQNTSWHNSSPRYPDELKLRPLHVDVREVAVEQVDCQEQSIRRKLELPVNLRLEFNWTGEEVQKYCLEECCSSSTYL